MLQFVLNRIDKCPTSDSLFGKLTLVVDNEIVFEADTLEPLSFHLPADLYPLHIENYSPKFKGVRPRFLTPFKDMQHILIHEGNKRKDTTGCVLVGTRSSDGLLKSRASLAQLQSALADLHEPIVFLRVINRYDD